MGMQLKLHMVTIEDLVPEGHFLRKLEATLDLSFVREETAYLYSPRYGRPSIAPVMLVKYLMVGYLYGIPSERQIEQRIQTDVALRWYLGLELFDRVPDHSTISQLRRRKLSFRKVFRRLFEEVVRQCIKKGLASGRLAATDSTHVDENGETKQKWETRSSYQDALKRKAEIESQKSSNSFLPPTNQNIAEFLSDFVSLYGEKRWGVSMYDSQNSLIANYINPIIGDMKVQDITTRVVDKYIQTLQKTPAVNTRTHHAKTEFVTNATIEKIIKLLRCAFKQAVRWELVAKNPFDNVVLPKVEYKKRDIWTADMIRTALDQCTDSKLYVAMNLAFACSLRMGEILGLTWSNVHISDEDIADDNAYVYIDKELARASKRAIEMLGQKDIYHVFTPLFPNTSTRIILKKPKTDSSIRKVWLPKTLAYILREWKSAQDELRALLRDEYQDYDLVVALANGRPCEDRIILKSFEKLREKAGLPKVVFHSLRHSSTTYKLKLNHGDLKATQGDTGHAQIDMITSVYAHILDEDRKINAQKFESAFYANPDLRSVRPPEEPKEPAPATLDLEALVEQLRKSPELANTLAALLASAPSEK